ncbi:unnamed protein product [Phaeothamnion confervicola]
MKLELAKKLGDEANDILGRLDSTGHWVKESCSKEEFEWYKKLVTPVMASVVLDLLNPFYEKYPEAKPEGYD